MARTKQTARPRDASKLPPRQQATMRTASSNASSSSNATTSSPPPPAKPTKGRPVKNLNTAAAASGATKKVGQLMAERDNIEGQANPPELAESTDDYGREDQPLAAEACEDESDCKEKPAPKKAAGRGRKRGAKTPRDDDDESPLEDEYDDEKAAPTKEDESPPAKRSRSTEAEIPREQIPTAFTPKHLSSVQNSKWYECFMNKEYHDTILIAADGTELTTYRWVLAACSSVFPDMFKESTVLPLRIQLEDFDAATIQSALDFMLEKSDSLIGKETALLKFAVKYDIHDLIDAISKSLAESVDASNVCEYIQLAYTNNFEELKKKCFKILVEKNAEVDPVKFADLPKNVISDFYGNINVKSD